MSIVYKNNTLYVNDEPVIHEGSNGYAEMQQLCWVQVGDKRVIKPVTTRVYAKDLDNLCDDIRVHGHRVATIKSYFKKSYGDEFTEGGVKSGTKGGPAYFTTASPNVMHKGIPLVRRGDIIIANNWNSEPGKWQNSSPNTPSFEDKCVSRVLDDSTEKTNVAISIQLNPNHSAEKLLPFQRALRVSNNRNEHFFKQTSGVSAEASVLAFDIPVNSAEKYEVYECANDPAGGVYAVHQGNGNLQLTAVDVKVFTTSAENSQQIGSPFEHSWIYVLKNGKVWREFNGTREVNLMTHSDKDIRPSTVPLERGFLLNTADTLAYAVSAIQLTWAQLNALSSGVAIQKPSWETYPAEETPKGLLPKDATFRYPHPAVAVVHISDPFGNAKNIAEQINWLHDFHLDELNKFEDMYHSAKLVGDVLEALKEKGEDYRKHVRENERLSRIEAFEKADKSYQEEINRLSAILIEFVKQSDRAQDFADYQHLPHLEQSAHDWWKIGMALNQTQVGRECVSAFYDNESSRFYRVMSALANSAMSPNIKGLALGMLEVAALPAAQHPTQFKKLMDWTNTVFAGLIDARLETKSIQQVYQHSRRLMSPLKVNPHSFVVEISQDYRLTTIEHDTGPDAKTVHVEKRQSIQLTMDLVEDLSLNGKSVHRLAQSFLENKLLHRVFMILSGANVMNLARQLKNINLPDHERTLLMIELCGGVADTISSMVKISEISVNEMKKIGSQTFRAGRGSAASLSIRIGGVASLIYAVSDSIHLWKSTQSGESGLVIGYSTSIMSSVSSFICVITEIKFASAVSIRFAMLTTTIVLAILGIALLSYFYKNDWEKWLFNSPWGESNIRRQTYQESLMSLFQITPMMHISGIAYQDKKLYNLIPRKHYDDIVREQIDGLVPLLSDNKLHIHHQLIRSPIEITLRVVPIPNAIVSGYLAKRKLFDESSSGKMLPAFKYSRFHHMDQNSGYMTIQIPSHVLAGSGETLVLALQYLMPNGHEYITLESQYFAIEYDPTEYIFLAKPIRGYNDVAVN